MEKNNQFSVQNFYMYLKEHTSIFNELENHQTLDLNNKNIASEFSDLINRLAQVEISTEKQLESLIVILNRLKFHEFTSLLKIIDDLSNGGHCLSVRFVTKARSKRTDENNFFLSRLVKLNKLKKLNFIFVPVRADIISILLEAEEVDNYILPPIEPAKLFDLLKNFLKKDENNQEISFDPPEYKIVQATVEQKRIAYLKSVINNFRQDV